MTKQLTEIVSEIYSDIESSEIESSGSEAQKSL
jgi:hypothetical protein